jgi:hypothetical protein
MHSQTFLRTDMDDLRILFIITQINLAAKKAVKKVTGGNVKRTVSGLNFSSLVVESTLRRMGIPDDGYASRPPYEQEITIIVEKLNSYVGSTWNQMKKMKMLRTLNGEMVDPSEYPWTKIARAIQVFPKWFEQRGDLSKVDHTFVHEAEVLGTEDFD